MSNFAFPPNSNDVSKFSFPNSSANSNSNTNQNFQSSYEYHVIDNPNEIENAPENTNEIDLDEIQRRSTLKKTDFSFNQIVIPDFDDKEDDINDTLDKNDATNLANNANNSSSSENNNSNNIMGFSFPATAPKIPEAQPSLNRNPSDARKALVSKTKTPSEYTLNMIFTQFIRLTEKKLNFSEQKSEDAIYNEVVETFKPGHDEKFDRIIQSLGYIAKKEPQQAIDSVMYWRKSKNDAVETSIKAYNKNKHLYMLKQKQSKSVGSNGGSTSHGSSSFSKMSLHSRNTSSKSGTFSNTKTSGSSVSSSDALGAGNGNSGNTGNNSATNESLQFLEYQVEIARQNYVISEVKANIASYLVCRVLIEVVKQMPNNWNSIYNSLEENIYYQLKSIDPQSVLKNRIKLLNWNCLAELLGHISKKRFSSISDRFIADLEKIQTVSKTNETHICLLIHGMKNLHLTNYPLEDFEECCGFLFSLAKFFYKSSNYMVLNSYCETLTNLLLPLCDVINAETDLPGWIDVIKTILKKINTIIDKSSYWESAFTLMCVCLSVAPANIFYDNWFDLINYNLGNKLYKATSSKDISEYHQVFSSILNEKRLMSSISTRVTLVKSLTRLLWTYLFRCTESLNKTTKKLDSIMKLLFFQNSSSKKQQWIVYDIELLKPLIVMLRLLGSSDISYTMESLLIPLMKISFNLTTLEILSPEKLMIVLKSYNLILEDMVNGESKPAYPTNVVIDNCFKESNSNFNSINILDVLKKKNLDQDEITYHEEISGYFCKLFVLLDKEIGASSWTLANAAGYQSGSGFYSGNGNSGDLSSNSNTAHSSPSLSNAISPSFLSNKSPFSSFHYFSSDTSQQNIKKQMNYELFEKLIETIPWFYQISNVLPYKKLMEILTRNSTHENANIASVAISTLERLCEKRNAGNVIETFSKFAFNVGEETNNNVKYSANFLILAADIYPKLLKIYYHLLTKWLNFLESNDQQVENIKKDENDFYILNGNFKMNLANTKSKDSPEVKKNEEKEELELNHIITTIEQVEGNGLFFLCSRSTEIRRLAVNILQLIPKFDSAVYENPKSWSISLSSKKIDPESRIINILETTPFFELLTALKLQLSMPERKRLAVLKTKNRKELLVKLAEADYGVDLTLWFKVFPKVLSEIFERSPVTMAFCRSIVCARLIQLHEYITEFSETRLKNNGFLTSGLGTSSGNGGIGGSGGDGGSGFGGSGASKMMLFNTAATNGNSATRAQPEILVEQWKLFLIVACSSLTSSGVQDGDTMKKGSKKPWVISSARSVFKLVLPLLNTEQPLIRDAIISGLSCININIFKALVEVIQPIQANWDTEIKTNSVNEDNMKLRIEVSRVLNVTSKFLAEKQIYSDTRILLSMVQYIKTVRSFLGFSNVQESFEYQKLRRYFCGLLENVFIGIQKTSNPDKLFPFEARMGCFTFLEEWCGHGDSSTITESRYNKMRKSKKFQNVPTYHAAIELEKTALEYSANSCMATLCSGAICKTIKGDKQYVVMAIDYNSVISWIRSLFSSKDEILHRLGRKGLKNLLAFNQEKHVFDQAVKEFYSASKDAKTAESYFVPVCEAILENENYNCEVHEILLMALFASRSGTLEIRKLAGKVLVYVQNRFYSTYSNIHCEIYLEALCSSSKLIYKRASDNLVKTFCSATRQENYYLISLVACYLYRVDFESQKDLLAVLKTFLGTVQLIRPEYDNSYRSEQPLDPYTAMVLYNLFEMTERFGETHIEEIENLWISLASAKTESNSSIILEFIYSICLNKRSSEFVECSKKIVSAVYQSNPRILNALIRNITPKAMIPPDYKHLEAVRNVKKFPYLYTMSEKEDKDMFSLGQISAIFLVDLLKTQLDQSVSAANLPLLLNIAFVLYDHYLPIVKEHAAELLCTLVYQLGAEVDIRAIHVVDNVRSGDLKYIWTYDDLNNDRNGARTPKNMDLLIRAVLDIFTNRYPTLQREWSRISLLWATTCSVRHIACRSFQAFRSLLTFLDQRMLSDMLRRLSNTISDPAPDIHGFAMQILMSLNAITAELSAEQLIAFPQLFWSAVACLSTVHEKEFIEVISIVSKFITKIDLNSEDTIQCLISMYPTNWEGNFDGLQSIVMIGLRSSNAWEPCLKLLDRLNQLRSSEVIAGPSRLMLALLANLPRFAHAFEEKNFTPEIKEAAEIISEMALANDNVGISRIVLSLANNKFRKKEDFISQAFYLIKESFFPKYQSSCLVFLLGLLMNKISWVKLETLELLKYLFPMIDLSSEEFQGVGADLLSPLLRLLLSSEYSDKALEVLDETEKISGSQLDKDFIRLSLGNKTLKKEYEKIATLFGIPEESGWSIPMPAVTAATTRNNVHAVYLTCQTDMNDQEAQQQDQIQFHIDEREDEIQSYYENPEKRSISNLYAQLNYFESFFEADNDSTSSNNRTRYHDRTSSADTRINALVNDTDQGLYKLDTFNSNNYNNYGGY